MTTALTKGRILDIDPYYWPRCERCNMPVEQFCVTDTGDAFIAVATCHGELRTVTIADEIWDHVGWDTSAFQSENDL